MEIATTESCFQTNRQSLLGAVSHEQSAPPARRPAFPPGTVARIFQASERPRATALAHRQRWRLIFERSPSVLLDPAADHDEGLEPLAQVELTFPTLGAAIAHAERQGLPFLVEDRSHPEAGRTDRRTARTALQQSFQEVLSTYLLFAWWDAQYGRGAMPDALELACTEGSGSLPAGQAGG